MKRLFPPKCRSDVSNIQYPPDSNIYIAKGTRSGSHISNIILFLLVIFVYFIMTCRGGRLRRSAKQPQDDLNSKMRPKGAEGGSKRTPRHVGDAY